MLSDQFRKSSYSGYSGSCVEVAFRKSSRSMANGNCVEVADGCGLVHVRDSKDPHSPVLSFAPAVWTEFLAGVKGGT
jgi:hypothetical protein